MKYKNRLKVNYNSIKYIDLLSEKSGLHFIHAFNGSGRDGRCGSEKKFSCNSLRYEPLNFFVDAWNEKFRIALEINEKPHYSKQNRKKDYKRKFLLEQQHNLNLIVIPWNENGIIDNEIEIVLDHILFIKHYKTERTD